MLAKNSLESTYMVDGYIDKLNDPRLGTLPALLLNLFFYLLPNN